MEDLKAALGEDDIDFSEDAAMAEEAAADELISAVKGGDPKAVVSAYKRLKAACESGYEDEV